MNKVKADKEREVTDGHDGTRCTPSTRAACEGYLRRAHAECKSN